MSGGTWYTGGLRFACTRCGNCCVGAGTVRVSDPEIESLARRLEVSEDEFRGLYTRTLRGGDLSLRERRDGACVFYGSDPTGPDPDRRGCQVYSDRPRQCRSWPFWRGVVHSAERWEEEARDCPGMNQGPIRSEEEIEASLHEDGTSGRPFVGPAGK